MSHNIPASQALALADLISYQDGSVVSRTLLKKDAANVTLFAFDAGQGLTEHTSPFDAFVHVLEGEAWLTINGQLVTACAGQVVLMPANQTHALRALSRFKMLLTLLRS
jgi:quercetin dioxygenase-like cupin family protein